MRVEPRQVARVKELADEGVVIYVSRTRSILDYLALNWVYLREGLPLAWFANGINLSLWQPVPTVLRTTAVKLRHLLRGRRFPDPARSGYLEYLCRNSRSSVVFLTSGTSLFERIWRGPLWDPIQALVEAQSKIDRPIYLVPQILFFHRRPGHLGRSLADVLFGETLDPGRIKKMIAFLRGYRKSSLHLAEPIDLAAFLRDHPEAAPEKQARLVRLTLRSYLYREFRVTTGPAKKPRSHTREKVLAQIRADLAAREGALDPSVAARAEAMFEEIASDLSPRWIEFMSALFTWIWNTLFRRVHVDRQQIEQVRSHLKKAPLVLVSSHKSHLDYLLISYLFYNNDITPPHIAAGVNLSFWPLGTIFRKAGAFFIRRSFGGSKLYPQVFKKYVRYMIREGYSIEFFIEGGRSRTGKLREPKYGLLQMVVECFVEGGLDDLYIVPIAINYDTVPEDRSHAAEMSGAPKKPESLGQLLGLARVLTKRYGRVYLRIGEIMSLADYVRRNLATGADKAAPEWRSAIDHLAHVVSDRINRVTTVTSTSIASTLLLRRTEPASFSELEGDQAKLLDAFRHVGAPLAPIFRNPKAALVEALRYFSRFGLVQTEHVGAESLHRAAPDQQLTLSYYRNTIVHYLRGLFEVSHALLQLGGGEHLRTKVFQTYERIDQTFAVEFVVAPSDSPRRRFDEAMTYLDRTGVVEDRPGGRVQFLRDRRDDLLFFAETAGDWFEAYSFVLRVAFPSGGPPRDAARELGAAARGALDRGVLRRPEAANVVLLENAHDVFKEMPPADRQSLAPLLRAVGTR